MYPLGLWYVVVVVVSGHPRWGVDAWSKAVSLHTRGDQADQPPQAKVAWKGRAEERGDPVLRRGEGTAAHSSARHRLGLKGKKRKRNKKETQEGMEKKRNQTCTSRFQVGRTRPYTSLETTATLPSAVQNPGW